MNVYEFQLNKGLSVFLVFTQVIDWQRNLYVPRSENISHEAIDLIYNLLCEPEERLGRHVNELKGHAFFAAINWESDPRDQTAPYIPPITHETDTSNFDPVQPLRRLHGSVDDLSHNTNPAFYEFTFRRFELMPAHISSKPTKESPPMTRPNPIGRIEERQHASPAVVHRQNVQPSPSHLGDAPVQPVMESIAAQPTSPWQPPEAVMAYTIPSNVSQPSYYSPALGRTSAPIPSPAHQLGLIHTKLQPQSCHPPSFSPPLCPDSALATYV